MRQKTYLKPDEQWRRTVAFYRSRAHAPVVVTSVPVRISQQPGHDYVYLGEIVMPHPLFRPGDLVLIRWSDGRNYRHTVYAVSSKGYSVSYKYVRCSRRYYKGKVKPTRNPLRFIVLPDDLLGKPLDDPALDRFIAGLLRAREAASG